MPSIPPGHQKVFRLTSVAAARVYPAPDPEQVDAWRDAYTRIGECELQQIPFHYRPLTRGEYRFCRDYAQENAARMEEMICQRATLWPEYFDFASDTISAGVPSTISRYVLDLSGFTKESREKLFHHWQERVYDQDERRDILIEIAYPHFSHADLDNLCADDYFHYLAKAEFRIRTQLLTSMNPEFSPDELVDLLLCPRDYLEKRLDQARDNIDAILEEQKKIEAQANRGRPRNPRPQ